MKLRNRCLGIGPGVIVAASGIGGSDIISATIAGAIAGSSVLWAIVIGAILKYALAEGVARWQAATGTTIIDGCARHLPRKLLLLFTIYLFVWCACVSGALIVSCGVAVQNLTRAAVPSGIAAAVHAAAIFVLLFSPLSSSFDALMKVLAALMVCLIFFFILMSPPPVEWVVMGLIPDLTPENSTIILSLIGGIGGSVTLLGYNYLSWNQYEDPVRVLDFARADLTIAYSFTGAFSASLLLLSSQAFESSSFPVGTDVVGGMAQRLGQVFGPLGFYLYSIGFWAAVLASLVGVWRLAPSILADCLSNLLDEKEINRKLIEPGSSRYSASLFFMFFSSIPFVFFPRPVAVVILFTLLSSVFIPMLAAAMLFLNNRIAWDSPVPHNGWRANLALAFLLTYFAVVFAYEIAALFV